MLKKGNDDLNEFLSHFIVKLYTRLQSQDATRRLNGECEANLYPLDVADGVSYSDLSLPAMNGIFLALVALLGIAVGVLAVEIAVARRPDGKETPGPKKPNKLKVGARTVMLSTTAARSSAYTQVCPPPKQAPPLGTLPLVQVPAPELVHVRQRHLRQLIFGTIMRAQSCGK